MQPCVLVILEQGRQKEHEVTEEATKLAKGPEKGNETGEGSGGQVLLGAAEGIGILVW